MRKLVLAFGVMVGLSAVPGVANAAPIGINTCVVNDIAECDIFANYDDDGLSTLGELEGNPTGYLVGYTFLLNAAADLTSFGAEDVAHILVIHNNVFELFSNIATSLVFNGVFNNARTGANIDGTSVTAGQLAGCPPIPDGVPVVGGVGYCTTADIVSLDNVAWAIGAGGGNDVLRIHTALPDTQPAPVPEPGTISLLALGGGAAAAAVLRRRAARKHS